MSETGTPALGGTDSAVAASGTPSGPESTAVTASADSGNAPGSGVDVGKEGAPTDPTLAAPPSAFEILNKRFRDRKHAEEVLGAELGKQRSVQRENSRLQNQLQSMRSEMDGLRALLQGRQGEGQEQGTPGGPKAPAGPTSFARELAENGELNVIAKIFADPEMGPAHAMYRMAELLDERQSKSLEAVRGELSSQFEQQQVRSQQERAVAKTFGVVKNLAQTYPELDESNQSEEAEAAQREILQIITDTFPPETLAANPERVLRMAVEEYRRQNGTPVFAHAPGTSGSPSVRAAQAAELSAAGTLATPLDGTGVPRQRPAGTSESPIERMRRENREFNKKIATTPSGRPLGFEVTS